MAERIKTLVVGELEQEYRDRMNEYCDLVLAGRAIGEKIGSAEELTSLVKQHRPEVLIVSAEPVSEAVIQAADNLKLIVCTRGNPINVDVEGASKRGIIVTNTPARNANAVAEYTIALIICCARSIPQAFMALKNRDVTLPAGEEPDRSRDDVVWLSNSLPFFPYLKYRGREIQDMTLGMIGFGAIGHLVLQKASALGMRILVYDPYVPGDHFASLGAKPTNLQPLLEASDFVSLHAKVTDETRGMIGTTELALMKASAYLINTARGALVQQDAVVDALRQGEIAGAALDVFEYEPLAADDPILDLENVIVTPHLGGASGDVVKHHSRMAWESVEAYAKGTEIPFHVNKTSSRDHP